MTPHPLGLTGNPEWGQVLLRRRELKRAAIIRAASCRADNARRIRRVIWWTRRLPDAARYGLLTAMLLAAIVGWAA